MTEHLWTRDELPLYEHVDCGALGHVWDFIEGMGMRKRMPPFGELIVRRCMRCTTERHDVVQRSTREVLSQNYWYPPGYKWAKGERPRRIDFFLMAIDETRRKRITTRRAMSISKPAAGGPTNQPTKTSNRKRTETRP